MANIFICLKLKLKQAGEVKGETAFADHKDEILIEKFRWGEAADAATATPGQGKAPVRIRDFEFWIKMCRASPLIMKAAATGDPVLQAELTCRSANAKLKEDFLKYTLSEGHITSYETEAAQDSMIPLERFTIRFRKLGVEFRPVGDDGTLGSTVVSNIEVAALGS